MNTFTKWFKDKFTTPERVPPHKTKVVPPESGKGQRIEAVHFDEAAGPQSRRVSFERAYLLQPVEAAGPEPEKVCHSTDCDNTEHLYNYDLERGRYSLCPYHNQHPDRIHWPKPEEASNG